MVRAMGGYIWPKDEPEVGATELDNGHLTHEGVELTLANKYVTTRMGVFSVAF